MDLNIRGRKALVTGADSASDSPRHNCCWLKVPQSS